MDEVRDDRVGDKVGVLSGDNRGSRGVIVGLDASGASISVDGAVMHVPSIALQNFSAAARKAWRTRPDRSAGRPKDPSIPRKKMVSLRLESDVWHGLGNAVRDGLIPSREAAVNEWLREKLNHLRSMARDANSSGD